MVLTAVPLEALDLPLLAMLLMAWLVAESRATVATVLAAFVAVEEEDTDPAGKLVCAAPFAEPPEVLM